MLLSNIKTENEVKYQLSGCSIQYQISKDITTVGQ